ncbi:hypothetical protein AK812_SmicGene20869 [Symbiodinium microadriaticum]|uniref:Uncharacterized protein n=1 Tax=Symbiodinium microadriaticum TaxID=2951 RepID=A0A1Q9DNU0_SYMMI|nr:hypothetical protein AK812_SmicGene20869 [Symbiodinium microadriaticum]
MGDDASAAKLVKLHFVFTWVLAVIVALNWCYVFKLALPQYSESILGWSIYTLVVTALMPLIRHKLQGHRFWSRPFRMTRLLLMSMTGTVVGTSWSGLVALLFPHISDFHSPGPTGITAAVAITFLFVVGQTILEKQIQEMPDPQTPENTYGGAVRSVLLNSLWSTLGYFWNSVWNRFLTKMQRPSRPRPRGPATELLGNTTFRSLAYAARDGPLHRFKTLQDEMNGRPEDMDSTGPGYRPILVKAVLTLLAGILFLCCLPEPSERYGSHRRRALIAMKMMAIIITSYAVTDAGFYFGTKLVADLTGSPAVGLAVSFLYAGLLTCVVTYLADRSTWHPERVFPNRLQTLGAWLVCYAWWYSWQEVLYQIQGFGLWQLGMDSVLEQSLQVAIAISGALCFALLLSLALVSAVQLGCFALPQIAAVLPQLKQASIRNCNFPEFSACLGLPVDERLHGIQLGSDQPASADAD